MWWQKEETQLRNEKRLGTQNLQGAGARFCLKRCWHLVFLDQMFWYIRTCFVKKKRRTWKTKEWQYQNWHWILGWQRHLPILVLGENFNFLEGIFHLRGGKYYTLQLIVELVKIFDMLKKKEKKKNMLTLSERGGKICK